MTETVEFQPIDALNAAMTGHGCDLLGPDGTATPLDVLQWAGAPDAADHALFLDQCKGPTLDVGCGAGRLAGALAGRGIEAMGIDISSEAIRMALERGVMAVHKNVFSEVPAEGHWQHALLADGNIGIGGDPVRLLQRIRQLLRPEGSVLVEVAAPGTGVLLENVRLRVGGRITGAFDWARVGADAIADVAATAGLPGCTLHRHGSRFMARLTRDGTS